MLEVGHVLTLDGEEYCVCDIKMYGNHKFCYTLRGEGENSKIDFFDITENNNGVELQKVESIELISELLKIFVCE